MTLASGLSEPLGALIGLVVLQPVLTARGVEDVEARRDPIIDRSIDRVGGDRAVVDLEWSIEWPIE